VAGAIYGGFAMVLTLAVPARELFGLKEIITKRHLDNMCKVMLATGLMVTYGYMTEFWTAWYSGHSYEQFVFLNRALGPYWWAFALMMFCNCVGPQILWFKWARLNIWTILFAAMCVNIGMWFERFVIVVTSLHRDFTPAAWDMFIPTWVDIGMLVGSFGLFFTLFLLFLKFGPTVAMAEVKAVMPQAHPHHHHNGHAAAHGEPADHGNGQHEG
jgi:molybdopterin-containing oxidoreductase family membrane subunit